MFAQNTGSDVVPVVTVQATQPDATAANPGVFTVLRKGDTNLTVNAWYDLGGTASNGVDYAMIPPHLVTIPAGVTSTTITITPLMDPPASGAIKTVVLQLTNSPLMSPVNYEIGSPSSAVVYIKPANPPPVKIISPQDGDVYYTPTNILLLAKVNDPANSVTNVEFFAGTKDLGAGHMVVLDPPGVDGVVGPVYLLDWVSVPPGDYPLTAVAAGQDGLSATSAIVNITVFTGPPANLPPLVRMVSPANGSIFRSPIDIPVFAYAKDLDGAVTSVEFFAGSTSLGFGRQISPPIPLPASYPTNLFYLVWSNAPVGGYALTAKATDDDGATTLSDPIKTTILPPVPPPTNHPAIVSIVATDPVAVEGTNYWTWEGETNSTPTWAAWPTAVCRPFTNCGPKNASFTVRRCGATNDDLVVTYATGGSASNGVDYVTLPGAVTIPAGKAAAMITLVPIDDGPPDVNKTVILTLLPDMQMNPLPGYVLGFPQRAAAIIIDNSGPHPATGMLSCGCFHLVKPGPDSAWFCIEYSTNLTDWTPICTNQVINGSIDFVDPDAANSAGRFYRVLPILNAP